jgi:hypothetical protein
VCLNAFLSPEDHWGIKTRELANSTHLGNFGLGLANLFIQFAPVIPTNCILCNIKKKKFKNK